MGASKSGVRSLTLPIRNMTHDTALASDRRASLGGQASKRRFTARCYPTNHESAGQLLIGLAWVVLKFMEFACPSNPGHRIEQRGLSRTGLVRPPLAASFP